MEIQEALAMVRALTDGVNPENGKLLTADVVYPYAPVVSALPRAVGALEILKAKERSPRTLPGSGIKSWSRAENAQRCEELRRGIDFRQITKTYDQAMASIIARLMKLGKIGPDTPVDMSGPKVA
jgi:hypothetical protein